jgi:hypothetical protein
LPRSKRAPAKRRVCLDSYCGRRTAGHCRFYQRTDSMTRYRHGRGSGPAISAPCGLSSECAGGRRTCYPKLPIRRSEMASTAGKVLRRALGTLVALAMIVSVVVTINARRSTAPRRRRCGTRDTRAGTLSASPVCQRAGLSRRSRNGPRAQYSHGSYIGGWNVGRRKLSRRAGR